MTEQINPADCPPDRVYMGTVNGKREIMRRFPCRGLPWETFENVHADTSVSDLVPLVEARPIAREVQGELWAAIRDELRGVYPSATDYDHRNLDLAASAAADAVVEYVNDRGGVPAERRYGDVVVGGVPAQHELTRALRERDEWKARAEKAERELDTLREEQWPRDDIKPGDDVIYLGNWYGSSPCPRGAVFTVRAVHEESGRVSFEWPGVEGACVDLSRVRKVEIAAPVPAPAVTRADVERADVERVVHRYIDGGFDELHASRVKSTTDEFMALLSGDDPVVFAVRESHVAAVEVAPIDGGRWWLADGALVNACEHPSASEVREEVEEYLALLAGAEAVARRIEAGATSDPVEAKAREIAEAMALTIMEENIGGHTAVSALDALARSAARHVLAEGGDDQ